MTYWVEGSAEQAINYMNNNNERLKGRLEYTGRKTKIDLPIVKGYGFADRVEVVLLPVRDCGN